MPRSAQSKEAAILKYFKTAVLPTAQVMLGLAKDVVLERVQRSEGAKDRGKAPRQVVVAPSTVAPKKKQRAKKKKARGVAQEDDFSVGDKDLEE